MFKSCTYVVEAYSARFPTFPQILCACTSAACLSDAKFEEVRIFTLCPLKSTVAGGAQAETDKPIVTIPANLIIYFISFPTIESVLIVRIWLP